MSALTAGRGRLGSWFAPSTCCVWQKRTPTRSGATSDRDRPARSVHRLGCCSPCVHHQQGRWTMRGKHAASWSIATPRVRVILAVDRAWALLSFTWTVPSPLHSLVPAREQPRVTATIDIIEAWQSPSRTTSTRLNRLPPRWLKCQRCANSDCAGAMRHGEQGRPPPTPSIDVLDVYWITREAHAPYSPTTDCSPLVGIQASAALSRIHPQRCIRTADPSSAASRSHSAGPE